MNMQGEAFIRVAAFGISLGLLTIIEFARPKRPGDRGGLFRWASNVGNSFLNTFLLRFALPVVPALMAVKAAEMGIGIFNFYDLPHSFAVIASILALDLVIYFQHRIFHRSDILWRLHRMHHTDRYMDAGTALRFHVLEIALSLFIKVGAIFVLGASFEAVVLFEIILNSAAMFNHANISLPHKLDRFLRFFLVTPDMHFVHHSRRRGEMNSNFGFSLSWWDLLFGTYRVEPADGNPGMKPGLDGFDDPKFAGLPGMLLVPFSRGAEAEIPKID
jgi:sterol desaturase/sphingolipid hydroxylase (fatty acid hydroxylase superfamily)